MYQVSDETIRKFENQTGQSVYQFIDNLSIYERDLVLKLMEIEYERGYECGYDKAQW